MSPESLSVVLPYQKKPNGGYFPVVPVTLGPENAKITIFALIDSGATVSVFRPEVARQLDIQIDKGEKISLAGVAGRILGFVHKLKIEIVGKKFICPVVFSEEYTVSFSLLGREAFFEQFLITFDEKNSQIRLD